MPSGVITLCGGFCSPVDDVLQVGAIMILQWKRLFRATTTEPLTHTHIHTHHTHMHIHTQTHTHTPHSIIASHLGNYLILNALSTKLILQMNTHCTCISALSLHGSNQCSLTHKYVVGKIIRTLYCQSNTVSYEFVTLHKHYTFFVIYI